MTEINVLEANVLKRVELMFVVLMHYVIQFIIKLFVHVLQAIMEIHILNVIQVSTIKKFPNFSTIKA